MYKMKKLEPSKLNNWLFVKKKLNWVLRNYNNSERLVVYKILQKKNSQGEILN